MTYEHGLENVYLFTFYTTFSALCDRTYLNTRNGKEGSSRIRLSRDYYEY